MSMYLAHFGLTDSPFTITPNPRYLFMSDQHREAMAHLTYGVKEGGGFVQLTGEVGTGKTTICRCILAELPDDVDVALITNPRISELELLATLCDELRIKYPEPASSKVLLDRLNQRLLETHAAGRRTVLIIDEAQNLSRQVLERVRLLTNLETAREKLLQIILIGQPELSDTLDRPDLRQLAQRITARYHLAPLTAGETGDYITHRLTVAGCQRRLFSRSAVRAIYRVSQGVPRVINVICDRALLGAFAANDADVELRTVRQAIHELYGNDRASGNRWLRLAAVAAIGIVAVALVAFAALQTGLVRFHNDSPVATATAAPAIATESTADDSLADSNYKPEASAALAGAPASSEAPVLAGSKESAESAPAPAPMPGLLEVKPGDVRPVVAALIKTEDSRIKAVDGAEPPRLVRARMQLHDLLDDGDLGMDHSFRKLAGIWGISLPDGDGSACTRLDDTGLKCLNANGDWDDLRRFDRPAMLALDGPDNERRYVIIRDLDADSARIVIGDREHRFSLAELQARWSGDYVVVWQPPTGRTVLRKGESGDDVLWLRRAMNFLATNGDSTPIGGLEQPEFDDDLERQVIGFQEQYALNERGIVGAETLITLNSRLNSGLPRLKRY